MANVTAQPAHGAGTGAKSVRRDWKAWRRVFFWVFVVFLYGPMAVIILLAFQGKDGGLVLPFTGPSMHWFADVFEPTYIGDFRMPFVRSLLLGLVAMLLTVVISFMAGLAFRRKFVGSGVLFYLTIASLITPSLLVSLGVALLFQWLDILPSYWQAGLGAHLTWTLPFGVLIMLAVFNRLDPSYEEAARDQGASSWQTLRHVIIPITAPGMVGVALFGFTLSYDEYPRTSLLSGDANTLPAELVSVQANNASPSLYAVGALTTFFSFIVIGLAFGALYMMQAQRAGKLEGVPILGALGKLLSGGDAAAKKAEAQRLKEEAIMEYRIAELEKKIHGVEAELAEVYGETPNPAGNKDRGGRA
ncbi:ABC transporter permease subunit [Marinibaculum pumilum]|uniref:ABC transporter permease subunit n=1 Tax=Marinibaculum pumilum TaxID=1766165 RepID=A0ABV7L5M3_9PROT